uniref:SCAN domain-containing protein 3 n=1 Tax=Anolis carolinensis TaxID=28377 RepID=G1KVP8_ANOCA
FRKIDLCIPLITLNFSLNNILDVGLVPTCSLTCIEVCAIAHCYCSRGIIIAQPKKKCRQYNIEYLKYGFIESPVNNTLPMCLICQKVLSKEAMKPSRLQEHLTKIHGDKKVKDLSYFRTLKEKFIEQPTLAKLFSTTTTQDGDGLLASYKILLMIAKLGKPHTIGEEQIIPAISEVIHIVLHKPASDIIKKISLSNNTVQRRMDEMAQDVEDSLCGYLKTSWFSIQLDESTLIIIAKYLQTDTKGESIFHALDEFFKEKEIPLSNILSLATDGAPVMVGCYSDFLAYLKKVPNAFTVHCIIHRQHLVAKNLSARLHNSLQYVIQAINTIRSKSLNDRLFKQLCIENDEEFNRLLLHTEVRWLSKGACLDRFYKLFNSVLEFLKGKNDALQSNLIQSKSDIAYLTDLFQKFNESNLQLQGDELNLIKTKPVISAFVTKLLYKRNFGRGEFSQFPNLSGAEKKDKDILSYCDANTEESPQLHDELMEVTTNDELKFKFKSGYQQFWLQKEIPTAYPEIWTVIQKFLIAFPSSYLVERGFSAVTNLLTKKRNQLQIVNRGDLRLLLMKIEPRITKLVAAYQVHPSH